METPPLILVADDDPGSNDLLRMAFETEAPGCRLAFVCDGRQAIDYLQRNPPYQDRPNPPDLLLLDIKMPFLDGFQVLERLAQLPQCRPKYVINISTSDDPKDLDRAWVLGADAYLVKPTHFADLVHQVRALATLLRTGIAPPPTDPAQLRLRPHPH